MRLVAQLVTDLRPIDAGVASLRGWLIALLAWFCEEIEAMPDWAWRHAVVREAYAAAKASIAAELRSATTDLRKLIFLRASVQWRFTTGRILPRTFAQGARPGLRLGEIRRRHVFRAVTAGVVANMHEGSLRDRIKRMRAMLDNPARHVARVLKRLQAIWRHPHGRSLVLVFAFDACESQAAPVAPTPADSS